MGLSDHIRDAEERRARGFQSNTKLKQDPVVVAHNQHMQPLPAMNTSSRLQSTEYVPAIPQGHQGNSNFNNPQPNIHIQPTISPLQMMEEANKVVRITKEFSKNKAEYQFLQDVQIVQNKLIWQKIYYFPPYNFNMIPESNPFTHESIWPFREDTNFNDFSISLAILSAVSIATQGGVSIHVKENWEEPTVLMLMLISEAGTRKSSLINKLRKPFDMFADDYNALKANSQSQLILIESCNKHSKKVLEKEMLEAVKDCTDEKEKLEIIKFYADKLNLEKINENKKCKILIENITFAGLMQHLLKNGESAGAITAEGDILNSLLLAKNVDHSFFNKLHSQEVYSYKSGRNEVDLKSPAFSMINFIQPSVASKIYKDQNFHSLGITARFLPIFLPTHQIRVNEANLDSTRISILNFQNKIKSLLDLYYHHGLPKKSYKAYVAQNALPHINNFENHIKTQVFPNMPTEAHPALRKLHGHAVRLSWCIHALKHDIPHDHKITEESVMQAIDLCCCLLEHIRFAYNPAGLPARNNAIKILENLKEHNYNLGSEALQEGWIDSRTIQQRTHIKSKDVENALRYLEAWNILSIADYGNRSNRIVLHPDYKQFILD